jgi:serine/threonine-protein kinase
LVLIPLLVAAVVGGMLAWQTLSGPSAPVPAVNGQTVADARSAIDAVLAEHDGLEWEIEERGEYSDGVGVGVVIRSDPAEGRSLSDGGPLTLVVSDGPEPVPVPDLFNYTENEARSILDDAQLDVGTVAQVFDEAVEAGRVVTWGTADAGEKPSDLPKGTEVDLNVSKGPSPRTIPSLTGAPRAEAEAELAELDLKVKVEEEFSSKVDKGLATRTDPAAGTQVERDSEVTLYISKGPDLVTVPSVKGLSLEQAVRRIENAGLVAGEVFGPANGRADTTDPETGSKVERGTVVDIYLRR